MYEEFYGLKEKPFTIQPDPDFLFFGRRHSMAYSMLEYGIESRAGFSVICGDIGCGKTTLVRHLLNNITSDVKVGIVYNTHQKVDDLLGWIMLAFEQPYAGMSEIELFDAFQKFLISSYAAGKRVVLIVDEAQNLSPGALESLAVDFFIPPLQSFEVAKYIQHRLSVAGCEKPLFTQRAVELISEASKGVPRTINILCDMALVYGFSSGSVKIGAELVVELLKDRGKFGALA